MTGAIRPLDVAAIVCIVAVLGFFAVMGAGRLREHSLEIRCQGNLRQMGKALEMYSKANHDLLPDCTPMNRKYYGPLWPWDISTNLTHELETFGMTREAFYCPANPDLNDTAHWNFHNGPARVIGYGSLFKGIRGVPRTFWREKLVKAGSVAPSGAELSFDAVASMDGDFSRVEGDFRDRSNHLRGKNPIGGNILFLDEHIEWRDFSRMQKRFTTPGPAGSIDWSF